MSCCDRRNRHLQCWHRALCQEKAYLKQLTALRPIHAMLALVMLLRLLHAHHHTNNHNIRVSDRPTACSNHRRSTTVLSTCTTHTHLSNRLSVVRSSLEVDFRSRLRPSLLFAASRLVYSSECTHRATRAEWRDLECFGCCERASNAVNSGVALRSTPRITVITRDRPHRMDQPIVTSYMRVTTPAPTWRYLLPGSSARDSCRVSFETSNANS